MSASPQTQTAVAKANAVLKQHILAALQAANGLYLKDIAARCSLQPYKVSELIRMLVEQDCVRFEVGAYNKHVYFYVDESERQARCDARRVIEADNDAWWALITQNAAKGRRAMMQGRV